MSTRPRQFDLIAFDWDGTLFDSTQIITRCIQLAVVDVGGAKPTDEAASYVIGMALMPALAHAAPDVPKDKYPLLGERYRFHYMKHANDIALFEGVLPLLAALREGDYSIRGRAAKNDDRRNDSPLSQQVLGLGVFDQDLHQYPAQTSSLHVRPEQDRILAGFVDRIRMYAHDAKQFAVRFVQRDEGVLAGGARHGFGGAEEIARVRRLDPFFAGDQRNLLVALDCAHPVINLARQQPQREAHHAAGMAAHPLNRQMRLAGVGRPQHGAHAAIFAKVLMATVSRVYCCCWVRRSAA